MNPALTAPAEYRTDTRATKQGFLYIAAFVLVAFFASALYGGTDWHEALGISVSLSAIFLAVLWLYGVFQIFDRRYVISSDGVWLFHRDQLLHHIGWSEVRSIRRGHLKVCPRNGRSISFNLPPPIQRQARHAIDVYYERSRNANPYVAAVVPPFAVAERLSEIA